MNRVRVALVVLMSCSQGIAFEDYCVAYNEFIDCNQLKACGFAAADASCDDIRAEGQAHPSV